MKPKSQDTRETVTVSIAVLQCQGGLDCDNYQELVKTALAEIERGVKRIFIDMTDTKSVSLAGLMGIYIVGSLLENRNTVLSPLLKGEPLEMVNGWEFLHEFSRAIETGQPFTRLLIISPQEHLSNKLHALGFDRLVPVYARLDEAMAAFED